MQARADAPATQPSGEAVATALRALTANLLRVTRGAGRPDQIVMQTAALGEAFAAYRKASGEDPRPPDMAAALALRDVPGDGESWPEWDRAVREMVDGALQVAAAELLDQPAQAAAGRREMFTGHREIEKLHARQLHRLLRR
jgi:hypothetical protein